jgi:quinol monooxygenase YgiN
LYLERTEAHFEISDNREKKMIYVIATVKLKPGKRGKYIEILLENVPYVKTEQGCLRYEPTIDTETDIPIHEKAGNDVVTIIEAWESVEALKAHFTAPHMLSYREKAKDLFDKVSIRVTHPL